MPGYFQNLCVYVCATVVCSVTSHSYTQQLILTLPFLHKLIMYGILVALPYIYQSVGKVKIEVNTLVKLYPTTHRQGREGLINEVTCIMDEVYEKTKRRRQAERKHTHRDFYRNTLYLSFFLEESLTWKTSYLTESTYFLANIISLFFIPETSRTWLCIWGNRELHVFMCFWI